VQPFTLAASQNPRRAESPVQLITTLNLHRAWRLACVHVLLSLFNQARKRLYIRGHDRQGGCQNIALIILIRTP
jgi:hypothetical protein